MSTLTRPQAAAIRERLSTTTTPHLAVGVGDSESPCTIAAINLALTGTLTDNIPDCMSRVIGSWIIWIQDDMPAQIRDSVEWREAAAAAAGTGREREDEVQRVVLDHMWRVLGLVPTEPGWAAEWEEVLRVRTRDAAQAAHDAALAYVGDTYAAQAAQAATAAADADAYAYGAAYAAARAADAAANAGVPWADINPARILTDLTTAAQGEQA